MPIRVGLILKLICSDYCFIFKAAADKLKREMEDYGFPPRFPVETTEAVEEEKPAATAKDVENKVDNKSKSKKVVDCSSDRREDYYLFLLFQ